MLTNVCYLCSLINIFRGKRLGSFLSLLFYIVIAFTIIIEKVGVFISEFYIRKCFVSVKVSVNIEELGFIVTLNRKIRIPLK